MRLLHRAIRLNECSITNNLVNRTKNPEIKPRFWMQFTYVIGKCDWDLFLKAVCRLPKYFLLTAALCSSVFAPLAAHLAVKQKE